MRIGIANDHASVEMKKELVAYLESQGHEVVNYGTDLSESTDYPIWGEKVSMDVVNGEGRTWYRNLWNWCWNWYCM